MAIQTQLYSENLGFPFAAGDDGGGGINPSLEWIDNACGINDFYLFNLQQQQQQQQLLKNQDFYSENGYSINANNIIINNNNNKNSSMHSRSLSAYIQKQNQEIEGFISLQNERLRSALQTHRKQQLLTILKKFESKSEALLKQKDDEIKRAITRRMELEELLRRTDIERQTWQMAAKEREEMVMNLNNTIVQVRERWIRQQDLQRAAAEDEGSCCHGNDDESKNNIIINNNNNNSNDDDNKKMVCKSCFREDSCVVMLPCRHLCSCRSCDVFLHSCPVCKMVKKATIQLDMNISDSHL
ncbi:hypothetical protein OSB04_014327 [Centaurea solstitialis]|uniref:RING-type domain-containing protein n=1 Tax=Centaurea solstitialis TaxID=347529 RepID=A0AA38W6B7_9ASTR|nr:hypothetical protein OSB04_014327 [Centaurea solstitialis]